MSYPHSTVTFLKTKITLLKGTGEARASKGLHFQLFARLRQEGGEFKASLDDLVSACLKNKE